MINCQIRTSILVFGLFLTGIFASDLDILYGQEKNGAPAEQEQAADKSADPHTTELLEVKLFDDQVAKCQLYVPGTRQCNTIVIFVQGTGPGTYLNKRKAGSRIFNYFDYFGRRFNDDGVALLTYNKRGVTIGETPPYYDEVDREKFKKVVPSVEVRDLIAMIDHLKRDPRFSETPIILMGWSEGTIIAPLVAEQAPDKVQALILIGYCHENLYDVIAWQNSGAASMIKLRPVFDTDKDGLISPTEYESDEAATKRFRESAMKGAKFQMLDADKDGFLDATDFGSRSKLLHNMILYHTSKGNDDWIWEYYFRVSTDWLVEHFQLEPNKSRLLRMDLPIHVIHGTEDAHLDVAGVRDLEQRFKALGKTNLNISIFDGHDHDLEFIDWVFKDEMSGGIKKIFEVTCSFNWHRAKQR